MGRPEFHNVHKQESRDTMNRNSESLQGIQSEFRLGVCWARWRGGVGLFFCSSRYLLMRPKPRVGMLMLRSALYKQGWASENRWRCLGEASQRSEGGCTRDKLFLSNPSAPSHVISSRPLCDSQDVFIQISHMHVLLRVEAKAWLNTVFFSL